MSAAKTNAERQREFRQRKADTDAAEVRGIFAHPDDHQSIKDEAAKIARIRVSHKPCHTQNGLVNANNAETI